MTVPSTEILVVDDEPEMCELVGLILARGGYRPTLSPRPEHALALYRDGKRFPLAVLDVVMPVITGEELARRLRADDPDLKILFLTGHADVLFRARPVLWHDEAFLEKPFTPEGLLQAISLLLHGQIQPNTPSPR